MSDDSDDSDDIESSDISNFASGYKVEGYPTHIIFVNSLFSRYYNEDRTANAMSNRLTYINTLN